MKCHDLLQEEACEEALKCNDTEVDGQHIRVERCKPKAKGGEAGAGSEPFKPPVPNKPAQKVRMFNLMGPLCSGLSERCISTC